MTVYVVSFEKDCFIVDKVFDSREKADKYMENMGYVKKNSEEYYYKNIPDGFMVGLVREIGVE